jgi:hypothetical protein
VSYGNWDPIAERSQNLKNKPNELGTVLSYYSADLGHIVPLWQRSLIDFLIQVNKK